MDPYLEDHWPSVRGQLVVFAAEALSEALPADLVAAPQERVVIDMEGTGGAQTQLSMEPDVTATASGQDVDTDDARATAVLAPVRLRIERQPRRQTFLEVRQVSGGRLVSVIEFLSPSNKRGPDRRRYLRNREALFTRSVNVVEVDLNRRGNWRLLLRPLGHVRPARLPESPYRALTFRPRSLGDEIDGWLNPMSLREPLPSVEVPLRGNAERVSLALQPLVDRAYRLGRFGRRIDYARPPEPPLAGDDAAWAAGVIEQAARGANA